MKLERLVGSGDELCNAASSTVCLANMWRVFYLSFNTFNICT